ncbi:protein lifeguard 3-like [Leptinotarsa decemlineata]|uniref:protein lifeguard 3-like n=1 Tax=Leptinotarsa decemlineata TaxID=7539 RepID=UPI003D307725
MNPSDSSVSTDKGPPNSRHATNCEPFKFETEPPGTSGLPTRISKKLGIDHPEEESVLPSPLHSLDDLSQRLLEQKLEMEGRESYLTVDFCVKEMATSTDIETVFSRNPRTQDAIVRSQYDSSPPPPYSYNDTYRYQGRVGSTPVYQEVYMPPGAPPPPMETSRAPAYQANYDDPYDFLGFENKQIRNRFIQKVYTILSFQLLLAFGFIAACVYVRPLKMFVGSNMLMMVLATVILFVLEITLFCYEAARRMFPVNFFLLFLLTFALAYVIAVLACNVTEEAVLLAVGSTALICLVVTFIAWMNWFDVTTWGTIFCFMSVVLIVYGLIALIITLLTGSNIAYIIYACLATVLFCLYLLYDTQQIMGGGRIALSPEEYI